MSYRRSDPSVADQNIVARREQQVLYSAFLQDIISESFREPRELSCRTHPAVLDPDHDNMHMPLLVRQAVIAEENPVHLGAITGDFA